MGFDGVGVEVHGTVPPCPGGNCKKMTIWSRNRGRWVAAFSAFLVAVTVGCRRKGTDVQVSGSGEWAPPGTNSTLAQVRELAAGWDATWLSQERAAQLYDREMSRFWDRTRYAEDPWKVVLEFLPSECEEPGMVDVQRHGDYEVGTLTAGGPLLSGEALRDRIVAWRDAGWKLVQSEWRTIGFSQSEARATSEVRVTLHLELAGAERRVAVHGEFLVDWRPGLSAEEGALPQSVRWVRGEWIGVTRKPRFREVFRAELEPVSSARYAGPVLVADLKDSGRDEVLLPGANRVLGRDDAGELELRRLEMRNLIPVEALLMASTVMDADGDGHLDLVSASSGSLLTFRGDGKGGLELPPLFTAAEELVEPVVIAQVDWDRDGRMDVWVGQYRSSGENPVPFDDANDGYPSSFWRNDGGTFTRKTVEAGLDWMDRRRVLSGVFLDLDGDGVSDLVRVCDYAGLDLLRGGADGRFEPVTSAWFRERRGYGMSHGILDLDADGRPDLVMTGMNSPTATRMRKMGTGHPEVPSMNRRREEMTFGNRVWLNRGNSRWEEPEWASEIAETGWTWGNTWLDPDNSGEMAWYVANGFVSGPSSWDAEGEFWCFEAYMESGRSEGWVEFMAEKQGSLTHQARSMGGHHRNVLFARVGTRRRDVAWLEGVAAPEDCLNVVAWDHDGDGRQDLLVLGEVPGAPEKALLRVFRNEGSAGNWLRVRVPTHGGRSPWGSRVELQLADGSRRYAWLVDQQGFQVQPPSEAHFGLGAADRVAHVEVVWPDGTRHRIEGPEINRVVEVRLR